MAASFLERFVIYKDSSKVALVCNDTFLTYQELYERSLCLASKLRAYGIGLVSTSPESYDIFNPGAAEHSPWVVIISDRSADAIVGIIATLMAGGAYTLIGADAPEAYINDVLEATAANIVLRNGKFEMIRKVDEVKRDLSLVSSDFFSLPEENEIACAIFTSGSTGAPKGAVLEHRVINEMLNWQTEYMKPDRLRNTALYSPFSFIAFVSELFFPLANGFTLHILGESVRQDIFTLMEYIENNRISYLFLPPDVAEVFTKAYKGSSLQYLRVAGGRLHSCGRPNGYEIMYHLGMSENGGSVTFNSIHDEISEEIPIGKAWHKTRVFLDKETSEIAVSGPLLFRGYLAQREETAGKLIQNPYTDEPGYEKVFMSGDLARLNEKGELVHMGRNDWNIKVSGMKVNPLQVEAVLRACKGVAECCVTADERGGENRLIGWIVGDTGADALKNEAARRLPAYMLPAKFVFIETLPRTVNGKIDRNSLVDRCGETKTDGESEGMSETELQVSELFARVLKLSRPAGLDESFLALGGNSLALMRLQVEISLALSKNIPYTVLFTNPTPRLLAAVLQDSPCEEAMPVPPVSDGQVYKLSASMRQMWLLWRTGQDEGNYSVSIKCRFSGMLDRTRVKSAFEDLVRSNAILRSRFEERDYAPFQVIEAACPEFSIGANVTGKREFDLTKTPIFDITIRENMLTFTTHHIIADAAGLRALMEDFWTLYGGAAPPKNLQVHEASLSPADSEKEEGFWLKTFEGGVPLLNLPADFARPPRLENISAEIVFFDNNETKQLQQFAAAGGATLFQLFLAAYALLLAKLSESDGVVIGVPFAGRERPGTARTIGMFVKALPVKLDVCGMNLSDALKHTRERFLAVWEHQGTSLERLSQIITIRRLKSRNPFYDTMINYTPLPAPLADIGGHKPEIQRDKYPGVLFDIGLDLCEEPDGVSAVFAYAPALFRPDTIRDWAEAFKALLLTGELKLENIKPGPSVTTHEAIAEVFDETADFVQDLLFAVSHVLDKEMASLSLDDDFYSLGGTSMGAIRIEAAMFEKGWVLSAPDIMMNPALGHMAALIMSADDIDWES